MARRLKAIGAADLTARPSYRENFLMKRLVYYAILFLLAVGVIKAYLFWLENYITLRPEVVSVVAMGYMEELPLEGVLIWDERVITAERDGILTHQSSLPRRVMRGETLVTLDGTPIRAESAGYFIPAFDGEEGIWTYSRLWLRSGFPPLRTLTTLESGAFLRRDDPIGKFVPQPQELRCIVYLDRTASLMRDISRGFIEIRLEPDGKPKRATVRAYRDLGKRVKVYLTLPFFPASIISTRNFSGSVLTGSRQGVAVPDTAVIMRGGNTGVLMVLGGMTEFRDVEGFPIEGNQFFITRGVLPGNVVVLHADGIREGIIRLW